MGLEILDGLDRARAGANRAFDCNTSMPHSVDLSAPVEILLETLRREGVPGALRFLNARTRHRFTALYRFDPPWLRNVCTVDRENPELVLSADCRIRESYCSLVFEREEAFAVDDASADPRVADHPKRESLLAYCGVPVFDDAGTCVGTLCHFDPRPRLAAPSELALLQRAARLLAPWADREAHARPAAISAAASPPAP
jgi:GAF domain-containing protein